MRPKQRVGVLFAGGILALALIGAAAAGPVEDGQTAFESRDYVKAERIWRPLAEQGNAAAQRSLGLMYSIGWGLPEDKAQALVWYRKAAAQGDTEAMVLIASGYMDPGSGYNLPQSILWFRKAADKGNSYAQGVLGRTYIDGYGISSDLVLAYMWTSLSVTGNDSISRASDLDKLAAKMTPDQVARARKMAREWRPK